MKTPSIIFSLIISIALISCKEVNTKKLETFDWGKGIYEEPFVGLFESRPSILVNSLNYPPSVCHRVMDKAYQKNRKRSIDTLHKINWFSA